MNKIKTKGFTLIEVLVALAILGFVLSASLKIFSSNSFIVATLEQKTLASFVAENILVQTFSFNNELVYAKGTQSQGGLIFEWERNIIFFGCLSHFLPDFYRYNVTVSCPFFVYRITTLSGHQNLVNTICGR